MKVKDSLARRIGKKIKETRKQEGLTLKQLADAAGLNPGTLSKIENGLTKPSITTLEMLANSLKVDIGYLFESEEKKSYVISRKETRKTLDSHKGYTVELIAEEMENPFMEPAIVTLKEKNSEKEIDFAVHNGQEFMYMLEGKMELFLGEKRYILRQGDAGYWNGSIPHMGLSLSKKPAKTLNVHFVPGKRAGTFETNQ